jgi:hypothetical protein
MPRKRYSGPKPDMEVGCRWHPLSGNRLEIVGHVWEDGRDGARRLLCQVRCMCSTEFVARPDHLRSGNTQSCGCLHRERSARRLRAFWEAVKEAE